MKLLLSILLLFIVAAPQTALAQAKIIPGGTPQAHPLLDDMPLPKDMSELANHYFKMCVAEDKNPQLAEYNDIQCGCTASRIPTVMSVHEMQKFFDATNTDSYFYTRLMTLAYTPCLEESISAFVYDDCLTGSAVKRLNDSHKVMVCQCMADYGSNQIVPHAMLSMPGMKELDEGFDLSKAKLNPLGDIVFSHLFSNIMQYPSKKCFTELLNKK
jgi:hypothetical protein